MLVLSNQRIIKIWWFVRFLYKFIHQNRQCWRPFVCSIGPLGHIFRGRLFWDTPIALIIDVNMMHDVNYVNVKAFYFYFTPILAEIDVKDIFYVLPCSYSQKGCSFTCQTLCVY